MTSNQVPAYLSTFANQGIQHANLEDYTSSVDDLISFKPVQI